MTDKAEKPGVAIVTGAAGGMGKATAREFVAQGWDLILCDLDEGRTEVVAAPLREAGRRIDVLAGDVSAPDFSERMVTLLGGRAIGAVVHTAGLSPTMGEPARIMAVNYDATARLVEAIRSLMAEGSCAVLVSSSSAYDAKTPEVDAAIRAIGPGESAASLLAMSKDAGAAYAISKRGVQIMVEREAGPFGRRKARIMSISPGIIDTPMGQAEQKVHPIMAEMIARTPLGRQGAAEEIATVASFLCSPAASFVTGSDIKVDGGVIAALQW